MQQTVAIGAARPRVRIGAWVVRWAEAERGRFMPWLPVSMALGVALYIALLTQPPVWVGPAASILSLLLTVLAWRSLAGRVAALGLLAASLGFLSVQVATMRALPLAELPRTAVVASGTVRAVDILPDGRRLVLDDVRLGEGEPIARRVRIRFQEG